MGKCGKNLHVWKLHCLHITDMSHTCPHVPHLTAFHTSRTSQHPTHHIPHSTPHVLFLLPLQSKEIERAGGYHASSLAMTQMPNSFAFKWWRECPCFLSGTAWDGGCPSIPLLQYIHREPGAGHAGEWVECSAVDGCTNTHTCTQTLIFLFYLSHTDIAHPPPPQVHNKDMIVLEPHSHHTLLASFGEDSAEN